MSEAAAIEESTITYDGPEEEVEATEEVAEAPQEEVTEEVAEAPAEEEQETPAPYYPEFDNQQQEFINDRIVAPKIAELRQTQRELEEIKQRLSEREESPAPQAQAPDNGPIVPAMPDIWEENYEQKIQERDQAIMQRAQWEVDQRSESMRAEEQQRLQAEKQMEVIRSKVTDYTKRAEKFGVAEKELEVAGNTVHQIGIDDSITAYVLDHEAGPAITMHLAKNFSDLQAVKEMNPMQAAVFIETKVMPKVSRAQKRVAPPEPTEQLKGSGVAAKERGPEGATYE